MNFISLFSGIGGFDLALENAGMKSVAACEIDKNAQTVLRRHFPEAELFDDVRKVGIATHGRGSVDLICGGFPCQDLSIAGKRAGLVGERSGLWFEFARIIDELEPKWVEIENVPGLLSSNKGKDFAVILRWLAERGYGVSWRVLDAQYFGVPQRRRRVFIVGSLGNGRSAEVLFERESLPGDTAPSRQERKASAGTFTIRSGKEGGGKGYLGQESSPMTLGGQPQWAYSIASNAIRRKPENGPQRGDISENVCHTLDTMSQPHAVVTTGVASTLAGGSDRCHSDITSGQQDSNLVVMAHGQANAEIVKDGEPSLTTNHEAPVLFDGRNMKNGKQSPTLQAKNSGGYSLNYTPMLQVPMFGVRRLTPLECERLQGFPDGWTDGQSDSVRYRQLGNAVAVPVVEWIAKRIAGMK